MKALQPYLTFNGNCREAMEFYAGALQGTLTLMTWAEAPEPPVEGADLVMHSRLACGDVLLAASDARPGHSVAIGKNMAINIECDSLEEQSRIFTALSAGGFVSMPLQNTFWGAHFGMLTDRFGISWLLDYTFPAS